MGFWKSAALLAGGAVAGYLAQRINQTTDVSQALIRRTSSELSSVSGRKAQVSRFFDSPWGQPLQKVALKATQFAAQVKSGMEEREAQLKQKFQEQKNEARPGSLDSWAVAENSDNTELIPHSTSSSFSGTERRVYRDRQLGEDFFEGHSSSET
ncbi:peptide chain release factor 4 [Rothia sp. CCM 9418]|uniref:peptide chain release factor 4 n=1 Tax=Rothia sp. CCM 9418 TaxID=3402661 RepID=UPI003AEB8D14